MSRKSIFIGRITSIEETLFSPSENEIIASESTVKSRMYDWEDGSKIVRGAGLLYMGDPDRADPNVIDGGSNLCDVSELPPLGGFWSDGFS